MIKILGKTATSIVLALILVVFPTLAYADGTADFNGEGATDVWQYDTLNVTMYGYDAFGTVMKELVPGDARSVNVTLRNNAPDDVEFRFMVAPVTGQRAQELEPYFTGKTADDSLLDTITIIVRHGTTQLYNGTLRGVAATGNADLYQPNGISLGLVPAGYAGILSFELTVPPTLGASAMNKLCAIEWLFVAIQYNDVLPPPPIDPGDGTDGIGNGGLGAGNLGYQTATNEGAVAPVVVGDTPVAELPDTQNPEAPGLVVEVDKDQSPGSSGTGGRAWALLNLLLTILTLLLTLWAIIRYFNARRRDEDSEEQETNEEQETSQDEHINWRVRRKAVAWLVGVLATIGAIILFILTEDIRLPMIWVDRYTIWHALIVLIVVIFMLFSKKRKEEAEQEEAEGTNP